LIDGHSLAFRSFYAFSKGGEGGLSTKEGVATSVTYGFLKALLDNCKPLKPDGLVVAFDSAEPTFRHRADEAYKAHRDVAPEHFFSDLANLQQILKECLDIPLAMAPGYEADDVLGTIANRASNNGWRVRILSGDRDLFQLVDDQRDIAVLYLGGGPYAKNSGPTEIRRDGVIAKLGVTPEEVVDLKALTGDSSDNIPGVKGVGPKTAINLLKEFAHVDGIYAALEQINSPKDSKGSLKGALIQKLRSDRENAFRSRMLAEILIDIPLPKEPRLELGYVNTEVLSRSLEKLELHSLVKQVENFAQLFSAESIVQTTLEISVQGEPKNDSTKLEPQIILTAADLDSLVTKLLSCTDNNSAVALDTETTSLNPFQAELVGIGVAWGDGITDIAYIPIGHQNPSNKLNQLSLDLVLTALNPWITSGSHPKALQNSKYDRLILLRHGLGLEGVIMDTMLADYLLDANAKHGLDELAKRNFGISPTSFTDLVAKGENFSAVAIDPAAQYCGMDVHLTWRLAKLMATQLSATGEEMTKLLNNLELPLAPVLAQMEATGIRIDIPYLHELGAEMAKQLELLEAEARTKAGVDFNLASPKQLEELLFETLGLDRKKSRKTKTGWSTDATVLEKLEADHPVVPLVLEHRTLSKLKSTYVDALPLLVEPETGRVHTDFNQAVTATGRLSSSNPNLQNIPIRTAYSRQIRKAFLPQQGWQLLSADYSQIELRILAHLSQEDVLVEAYKTGADVHALTARLLLDKAPGETVTSEERRLGKTINFGVIYGMGAQRFARETGVGTTEAKEFLAKYKQRYQKVFAFLESQERYALSRGYVETILGRRRLFHFDPNGLGRLLGKNPFEINLETARRGGMEAQQLRAAANAPIQGSSADIIKLAMVQLQQQLNTQQLPARLLLQVHDELVLESPPSALEEVIALTRETMQNAVVLSVPLVVDIGVGPNWMETK
jgi:DNA polymerase-1